MSAPLSEDRKLAAEVRRLALGKMKALLAKKDSELKGSEKELHDAVLLKLASSVLPRLNEVSGQDGEPIVVSWLSQSPIIHADGQAPSTNQ